LCYICWLEQCLLFTSSFTRIRGAHASFLPGENTHEADPDVSSLQTSSGKTAEKTATGYQPDPQQETSRPKHHEALSKTKPKGKSKKKSKAALVSTSEEGRTFPSELTCSVCRKDFHSRNKLFQHIKDSGHAIPKTGASQATGKKSGRSKKSRELR